MVRVLERLDPAQVAELLVDRDADGYVATVPHVGTLRIERGGAILARAPDPAVDPAELDAYLEQQIAPLLGQLSGAPHLHGSAAVVPTARGPRAVGFLGRSGQGKSTLAASLATNGGALLADDCIDITLEPRPVAVDGATDAAGDAEEATCAPTRIGVRLREDSLGRVGGSGERQWSYGKTEVDVPRAPGPTRLARLYVLEPGADDVALVPLRQRDALVALAANAHRLDPTDKALLTAEVAYFERVARAVPMYRLQVPRDFSKLPLVHEAILSDLAGRPVSRRP